MTNSNILIGGTPRVSDNATVTAGGEVSGFTGANVQDRLIGRPWRTPTLYPHETTIRFDHGAGNTPRTNVLYCGGIRDVPEEGIYARVIRGASVTDPTSFAASWSDLANVSGSLASLAVAPSSGSAMSAVVGPTTTSNNWSFKIRFARPASLDAGPYMQMVTIAYRAFDATGPQTGIILRLLDGSGTQVQDLGTHPCYEGTGKSLASVRFDTSGWAGDLELEVIGLASIDDYTELGAIQFSHGVEGHFDFDTGFVDRFPAFDGAFVDYTPDEGAPLPVGFGVPYYDTDGSLLDLSYRYTRLDLLVTRDPVSPWSPIVEGNRSQYTMDVGRVIETPALSGIWLEPGYQAWVEDSSQIDEALSLVPWVDEGVSRTVLSFELGGMPPEVAMSSVFDMLFRRKRLSDDILVMLLPEEPLFRRVYTVWGLMSEPGRITGGKVLRSDGSITVRQRP